MTGQPKVFHLREGLETAFGFAQARLSGGFLFISGSASIDDEGGTVAAGDMAAQTRNAYGDISKSLEAYGLSFENVVKETVFTTDIDGLVAAAEARAEFYKGCTPPASAWIQVSRLYHPDLLIEVEVIASLE